jgi:hypothetical protein
MTFSREGLEPPMRSYASYAESISRTFGHSSGWAIVCPEAGSTLRLAASLNDAGFEAWTPVEMIVGRARKGAKPEPQPEPLMAGFVFVRGDRLHEIIALSHAPSLIYRVWDSELRRMVVRGHPYFRMFRPNGEIRLIPDRQLGPLRETDWTSRAKASARALEPGQRVRLLGGGFDGLRGAVRSSGRSRTKVLIDDWREVDVPTWSLELDEDGGSVVSAEGEKRASRYRNAA